LRREFWIEDAGDQVVGTLHVRLGFAITDFRDRRRNRGVQPAKLSSVKRLLVVVGANSVDLLFA
jgi:hypothetical protein